MFIKEKYIFFIAIKIYYYSMSNSLPNPAKASMK
jgi:hypothetical protein